MASASPLTAAEPFSFLPPASANGERSSAADSLLEAAPLLEPSMEVDGGFPSLKKLFSLGSSSSASRADTAARHSSRGSILIVFGGIFLFASVVFFVSYSFQHFYISLFAAAPFAIGVTMLTFGALDVRHGWMLQHQDASGSLMYT